MSIIVLEHLTEDRCDQTGGNNFTTGAANWRDTQMQYTLPECPSCGQSR
ncbi:hypothetical protein [Tateyamaria sp. Alg231-49]|nr:hypothetical protein [Tateyamaria sp. Alg231-49]